MKPRARQAQVLRGLVAGAVCLLAPLTPTALAAPSTAAADPVVISTGHVDLGPHFVDGAWTIGLRDDTIQPAVWRDLDDVVLHANAKARIAVPADPAYAFLGTAGEQIYVIPQVQQDGVIWPGWNTQAPDVEAQVTREVTWSLDAVEGPGVFTLFLNSDFGRPTTIFDSRTPYPQQTGVDVGTHVHGNWTFTTPGTYRLRITMTAHLKNNSTVKDQQTLTLHAGDTPPQQQPLAKEQPADRSRAEAASTTSNLTGAMVAGGTALVLVLTAAVLIRRRRTR
ncbi:choice-of-anchor M domain-containing protein [Kribbella sp. NPDC051770]|uniref:choice-of-anchor M domain-containing protein n=1 Tax=Kribbella sp. NPDC051770 TaxID=3155413 RepID=UPI0034174F90